MKWCASVLFDLGTKSAKLPGGARDTERKRQRKTKRKQDEEWDERINWLNLRQASWSGKQTGQQGRYTHTVAHGAPMCVAAARIHTSTHSLQGITLKRHVARYPSCINLCYPKNLGQSRSIWTQFGRTKYQHTCTHTHTYTHTRTRTQDKNRWDEKNGEWQTEANTTISLFGPWLAVAHQVFLYMPQIWLLLYWGTRAWGPENQATHFWTSLESTFFA